MTLTLQAQDSSGQFSIVPQGAHITSWKTSDGKEQLFLSKETAFKEGQAIRGGVPLIFPQFGQFGEGQKHGFARTSNWTKHKPHQNDANTLSLTLEDNESTRARWPYRFAAEFTAIVQDDTLTMTLHIHNKDNNTFKFTAALHTYLLIDDIDTIGIEGFQGNEYWDNGTPLEQRQTMSEDILFVSAPIDRVYFSTTTPIQLLEPHSTRTIIAQGFNDSVVWNPGLQGAQALQDMGDDEYRTMVCVESAVIGTPIALAPNETWEGAQKISYKTQGKE